MLIHWILLLSLSGIAAVIDASTGRIPNRLTLTVATIGLVVESVQGLDVLGWGLIGGLTCSAVPLFLYWCSRNAIGGGDIKVFATLGLLLGSTTGLEAQLVAYVLSFAYALFKLGLERKLRPLLASVARVLVACFRSRKARAELNDELLTPIRIGPAIFASCLLEAYWSWSLP